MRGIGKCPYCGSSICSVVEALKRKEKAERLEEGECLSVSPFYKKPFFIHDAGSGGLCSFDELTDVVACPGVILPSLKESCYVGIEVLETPATSKCEYEELLPDSLRKYL